MIKITIHVVIIKLLSDNKWSPLCIRTRWFYGVFKNQIRAVKIINCD